MCDLIGQRWERSCTQTPDTQQMQSERKRVHGRFPGKAEGGRFGTKMRKEASSERAFQAEVALKVSGDSSNLTI